MSLTKSYRWMVASRVAAAAVGGYALTSAVTVLLSLIWPISKADAVASATMLSFTLYAVVIIWVFCTPTATRAWAGVVGATAVVTLACWLLMGVSA
ncbi:DUF3649 domain-containing protein [Steroidobacter sp.]|uniref:DUF3649 domain-containing protein n=1 Tax=Steroidobacter sp. TaxID=1978227 RepID=UPI001A57A63F|nr:hypothetical protein [Steroidobacter sp.]MBL8269675.1 DUF3649 domain-containing protein [Steroidobacter sp.]